MTTVPLGWMRATGTEYDQWYFRETVGVMVMNTVWVRKTVDGVWEYTTRADYVWRKLPHARNAEEATAAALSIWRML